MNWCVCLLAGGFLLCFHMQVNEGSGLSRSIIERAVAKAKADVDEAYQYSRIKSLDRVRKQAASPSDVLRLLKQPVGIARLAVRSADYMSNALTLLTSLKRRNKRSINATDLLSDEDLKVVAELTGCTPQHRPPSCETTPNLNIFRSASNVCNNRQNPRWGSSNRPFTRWLPAEYQNGVSEPKGWDRSRPVNDQILPLVREVSNRILRTANSQVESDPLYTHLVTIFGQWTDHDLTFTPHSPVIRSFSNGIDCEKSCERTEPCFPIEIPMDDPRFGRHSEECIPFFRSAPTCGSGNTGYVFGQGNVREQINTLTAFIDVGQVYGADDSQARFLRDFTSDRGLLEVNPEFSDHGRELLPFSTVNPNLCATRGRITNDSSATEVPCFLAGDIRVYENIALTSLHTLLMREHNRLVRALATLNPRWNGERLYQEARKIMGAYFQVLTFRDYLLHIVGPDFISKQLSTYPGYDETVDPSISNVFATAAYRFAHLMVQPTVFRLNEEYRDHPQFPSVPLHTAFFAPWRVIFEGGLDPILRGLVGRQAKLNTQDHMMHDELRDRLFKFSSELALDLAALNLQRGRDHGLPGYNKWREFCGLSQPRNMAELAAVMNNTALAEKLLDLYQTPDNIDVWLGGVAEPFVPGGRVGPLFACLISTQFRKIRLGDRLWWENPGVFTEAQRISLRNTSLARIICDNTNINEVPQQPFLYRPRGSGYTNCNDLPVFDLSPWKEDAQGEMPVTTGPHMSGFPPRPPRAAENVAFSVRLGNDFPSTGQAIVFRDVIYNGQNSYNTRNGYFTCEIPGVHEFSFYASVKSKDASLDLFRNNNRILHSFTTRQNGFIVASGNLYVSLKRGDRVYLVAGQTTNGYEVTGLTKDSIFSGHLLFTE